jgi:hypothetical protein
MAEEPRSNSTIWNRLYVNGDPLPGIIQDVTVGGSLRMDTQGVAGQDGVVIGNADWSEDTVSFQMIVPSNELRRMKEFRAAYKNRPGFKPEPITVSHPLLKEMGIVKMILTSLEINWNVSMKDSVPVTIQLTNITPRVEKVVPSKASGTRAPGTRADGTIAPPATAKPGEAKAGTKAPASIKPNSVGLPESNEIAGQPKVAQPQAPGLPGPKR